MGFPGGADGKEPACNAQGTRDVGSIRGSGRFPGGGSGNPAVFLPGDSHGQRSLAGYLQYVGSQKVGQD